MLGSRRSNGARIADAAARAAMAVCVAALCAVSTPAGAQGYSRAAGTAQSGAAWNTTNAVTISSGWTTLNSGWPVGQIYSEIGSGSITSGTSPCSASKRQPAFTLPWAFNYGGQSCSSVVMMRGVLFCTGSTSPLSANGPNGAREACESGDRVSDAPGASMDVGEANAGSTAALLPMNGQFLVNDSLVQKPNLDYAFVPMYGGSAPLAYYGEGMGNSTWCFGTDAGCTGTNKLAVQVATSTAGSAPNRVHTIAYRVSWTRRNNPANGYTGGCSTVPNSSCFYEWQVQLQENGGSTSAQPFRYAYRCANCSGRGTDQFPFSTASNGTYGEPWRKGFIMAYESTNANSSGVYCSGLDQGCIAEQSFTPSASSTTLAVSNPNPSAYVQGQAVSWTATVSNSGAATNNVNMTFSLPSGVTFSNWSCANGTGGTCGAASGSGTTTTASFSATGSVTYTFNGTVNATTTGNLALAVQASGGTVSDPGAPRAATGSASMRLNNFLVSPSTSSTGICAAGNTLTYTVTARDATNTTIANFAGTVSLSMGAYTSAAWSGSGVTNSGSGAGSVTFTAGTGSATATLTASALGSGSASATLGSASGSASAVSFLNNGTNHFTIAGVTSTDASTSIGVAGRSHTFRISANTSCPSSAVATTYSGAKTLAIWRTNDGAHPSWAAAPTISGVAVPTSESATWSVTFASGVADVVLASTDVGKFTISVSDASNNWSSTKMNTTSPFALTLRPFGFSLESIAYGAVSNSASSGASSESAFAPAGRSFNVTVKAKRWEAGDDANNDGVPDAGASLANNADLAGFAGATTMSLGSTWPNGTNSVVGALSGTTSISANSAQFVGPWSSGVSSATIAYSEVGIITLSATASGVLGTAGANASGSAIVGRFYPDNFLVAWNSPSLTPSCGGLSYAGQSFTYASAPSVTLTARNASNQTTLNYADWVPADQRFNKLPASASATWQALVAAPAGTTLTTPAGANTFTISKLGLGISSASAGSGSFDYSRGTTAFAPFAPSFRLSALTVADADGVTTGSMNSPDFGFTGAAEVRYGRLEIVDTSAPGSAVATVTVRAEHATDASGSSWAASSSASGCLPAIAASNIALSFGAGLSQCDTAAAAPSGWSAGAASFTLAAPGAGKSGTVTARLNLGVAGAGNFCAAVGGAYNASSAISANELRDLVSGAFANPQGTITYDNGTARRVFVNERF